MTYQCTVCNYNTSNSHNFSLHMKTTVHLNKMNGNHVNASEKIVDLNIYNIQQQQYKVGYVYVLDHESYQTDTYKIGETVDIDQRLVAYNTCFETPPTIKYITKQLYDCKLAEKIVFNQLTKYRLPSHREKFNHKLDKIITVIAGYPKSIEDLKAKGLKHFIHMKSNLIETLQGFQTELGI